jgi:hypothetical protein
MAKEEVQPPVSDKPQGRVRDLPGCIKYILLLLLILLLIAEIAAGEFGDLSAGFNRISGAGGLAWLILIIKLILIAGLIVLIRVQRSLKCEITDPKGCAPAEIDTALGKLIIRVKGTASGAVFGSYTLEVQKSGMPASIPVIYPGGGTSGTTPVVNGELGKLDVTGKEPDGYDIVLTVNPIGAGTPKTCTSTFEWLRAPVVIDEIGEVTAYVEGPHPDDPSELLKLVKLSPTPADPETSVGGSISVDGSADLWGCGRQMIEYVLQRQDAPFGTNPPQQDDAGPWTDIKPALPFSNTDPNYPRWYYCWPVNRPNFVLNGDLTREWKDHNCLLSLFPTPTYHTVRRTMKSKWDTSSLNGRYTVRLRVRHDVLGGGGPVEELYDAITVWLDNRPIKVQLKGLAITGGLDLEDCEEVKLSQFLGTTLDIKGIAWDPLILDSVAATEKPNDNFDYYTVSFAKDSDVYVTDGIVIPDNTLRVPNVLPTLPPPPGDIGVLATWDIVSALDAGPAPAPSAYVPPPYPKLYRTEHCAYIIHLYARDKTRINDMGDIHDGEDYWPLCIINDLPGDLPFPAP